jgi:hypothetical protein
VEEAVTRRKSEVVGVHPCDANHQVLTVHSSGEGPLVHRMEVCAECPWRKDAPLGAFPVEAYLHSSRTAEDMAQTMFSCHMSGSAKPATCAGYLLSINAAHSLLLRLAAMQGRYNPLMVKRTVPTYENYYDMAVANGVDRNLLKHVRRK